MIEVYLFMFKIYTQIICFKYIYLGDNGWLTSRYESIVLRKIKELADGWKKRGRNYLNINKNSKNESI